MKVPSLFFYRNYKPQIWEILSGRLPFPYSSIFQITYNTCPLSVPLFWLRAPNLKILCSVKLVHDIAKWWHRESFHLPFNFFTTFSFFRVKHNTNIFLEAGYVSSMEAYCKESRCNLASTQDWMGQNTKVE